MSSYLTALEHFNEHRNTLKMTTGSANLDSLIDSIEEGQCYLFYGSNKGLVDGLAHLLLVNCVLPVREKHGFESMAMYINNFDYYQPDKSKVLSPEKITIAAKCVGIEPKIVFKNLYVQHRDTISFPDNRVWYLTFVRFAPSLPYYENSNELRSNVLRAAAATFCHIMSWQGENISAKYVMSGSWTILYTRRTYDGTV